MFDVLFDVQDHQNHPQDHQNHPKGGPGNPCCGSGGPEGGSGGPEHRTEHRTSNTVFWTVNSVQGQPWFKKFEGFETLNKKHFIIEAPY